GELHRNVLRRAGGDEHVVLVGGRSARGRRRWRPVRATARGRLRDGVVLLTEPRGQPPGGVRILERPDLDPVGTASRSRARRCRLRGPARGLLLGLRRLRALRLLLLLRGGSGPRRWRRGR